MKHTKTLRRGLGILLALMLCLTLLPATALAETGIAIDEENFPDDYFRQYVSDEFDSDNDGKLSADEIKAATEIDVYDEIVIESLTGIEYFTNLEYLDCAGNKLTTLDISHNTKVELLDCYNNSLTELKIGQNTSLTDLYCYNNQLTSLDVSMLTSLEYLHCSGNYLTSLNISKNTALESLECYENELTELNVDNNTALESLECDENELTSLDVSQNTALVGLNCSGNYLTSLNISKNTALESLECYENELTELNVDNNTALKYLECSYNRLEELDVSYNTALVELSCTNNYLTELKFGSNPALQRLLCGDNILTSLEFGNNTNLSQVDCENNKLTSLDLSKTSVYYLTADNNIYDITVDADRQFALSTLSEGKFDVSKAEILSGGNVDQDGILTVTPGVTEVTYTYDCGNGNYPTFTLTVSEAGDVDGIVIDENSFPDANFRNFVSKKIDNGDGVLSSQEIARTTSINCSYKGIADLTGIEHFTALEYLHCYDNYLTELKLQNNKALEYLECDENELTSLDVSQNTALVGLYCSDNYLTSLDVSKNTALVELYCSDNYLTSLDLSNNKALEYLHCSYNELTSLDLSNNTSLWALNCDDNSYDITTTNGTFDLSTLPGFAAKKASAWTGGTVKGNILTVNEGVTKVTYTYNCGNEKSAVFTLNIVGNTSTYTITVESAKNGTITASPKSAAKDDTVTLTVTPDKGYTLETITVTDKNGDKVKLTEKSGKYTFTMPVSKVTVKATFAEVVTEPDNPFVDLADDTYYYDAVLWAAEEGITGGVDDTHFAPKATCTRAQAVTFLWRAAGSPAPKSSTMPFTDVKAGSYYYDAVLWAVENGITKGTSDTTFSRDVTCSRAQIVTFLWRSQEAPAAGAVNPFTDVKADAYYAEAVLWAVKEDVTKGTTDTTFSPKADCTRAQIVTFIWRALAE